MPLTDKGDEIKSAMAKTYGPEKGEKVFYASKNKGTIEGVDEGEGGGEGGSEIAAWAGLMSDEDVGVAMDRFDEVRDGVHKLDKRLDDCAAMDDRSSEGHAKAAAEAPPDSLEKKFHAAEVGRKD